MSGSPAKPKPMDHAVMDHRLERLIFFSDAVFAIAITLLVIEIHVPHLTGDVAEALRALTALAPSLFGFALSFVVIGRFWIGHHAAMANVECYSPKLLWPNLHLLMAIAFMPFATAFMSANIGQLVPTAFYNAVLIISALLSLRIVTMARALWPVAERHGEWLLLGSHGIGVALGAASALALTFYSPIFSQLALITIPLWQRLAARILHARRSPGRA